MASSKKSSKAWTPAQRKNFMRTIKARKAAREAADHLPDHIEEQPQPQFEAINWKLKYYKLLRQVVDALIAGEENAS